MNRTDRLHALSEELRRAGAKGRTAEALAGSFEVSTRTIKRDISALQQAGFPLWSQAGPGGGYVVDDSASLPPVNFTPTQVVAIATALASAPPGPYRQEARAALAKLIDVLGPSAQRSVEQLGEQVWVRQDETRGDSLARQRIEQGLSIHRVVSIEYRDAAGAATKRLVEPQFLAFTAGRWYLAAWCTLRDGPRWFRFDRIVSARLTAQSYSPRDLAVFGTPPEDAASITTTFHPT